MAETVKSIRVEVIIQGVITGADGSRLDVDEHYIQVFNDGTGTDQIGLAVQDLERPLNATSEDLNLDGLADFQGAASGLANLGIMYFRNLDEDTGDTLTIGGASGNQFVNWVGDATDKVVIGPKGIFLLVNPVDKPAITASTGDLLKVEAADNSNYRFIIGGDNA